MRCRQLRLRKGDALLWHGFYMFVDNRRWLLLLHVMDLVMDFGGHGLLYLHALERRLLMDRRLKHFRSKYYFMSHILIFEKKDRNKTNV